MILPPILQNPLVIGSLGLSAGSVLGYFRDFPKTIGAAFERFFTCSIQVSNMDCEDTFGLVREWVSTLEYARKTRNLTGVLKNNEWILTPAPGNHFFWFEGHPVWLKRDRANAASDIKTQMLKFQETITLRVMTRNKGVVDRLCRQVEKFGRTMAIPEGSMKIYTVYYSSWNNAALRMARPIESVILPTGEMDRIQSDLERFWAGKEWYREMGIPYRRGWLFQGVPGSGKTSLVAALAGHYRRNIFILNLSTEGMDDGRLLSLVGAVTEGSIILLEDIDTAFHQRDTNDAKGITFSGLLNALDGVASPDGTVVIMTTNHPEKLDPALIRPGRIDQVMDFNAATNEQLSRLHKRFIKDGNSGRFVADMKGMTVAEAQEHLLRAIT